MRGEEAAPGQVTADEFARVRMQVGRVVRAEPLVRTRKPAYQLWIDFGPEGVRRSSAQLAVLYGCEELVGRLVVAVTNLPPRQVANVLSEVLVLGVPGELAGEVVLLRPDREVELGSMIF